jgi:hypothetical protein
MNGHNAHSSLPKCSGDRPRNRVLSNSADVEHLPGIPPFSVALALATQMPEIMALKSWRRYVLLLQEVLEYQDATRNLMIRADVRGTRLEEWQ